MWCKLRGLALKSGTINKFGGGTQDPTRVFKKKKKTAATLVPLAMNATACNATWTQRTYTTPPMKKTAKQLIPAMPAYPHANMHYRTAGYQINQAGTHVARHFHDCVISEKTPPERPNDGAICWYEQTWTWFEVKKRQTGARGLDVIYTRKNLFNWTPCLVTLLQKPEMDKTFWTTNPPQPKYFPTFKCNPQKPRTIGASLQKQIHSNKAEKLQCTSRSL